jgi:hypothetical protein
MLKRYSPYVNYEDWSDEPHVVMDEEEDGNYVHVSSYEALERKLEAILEIFNTIACTPGCNGECSRCRAETEIRRVMDHE